MLTATDRKQQKSLKGDITHHHIAWKSTWCWVISPFNDFCCFRSVAVNTADKLQFLIFIFAVFMPNLCNCVITEYIKAVFSIVNIAVFRDIGLKTGMDHRAKFHQHRRTVAEIWWFNCFFSKWRPVLGGLCRCAASDYMIFKLYDDLQLTSNFKRQFFSFLQVGTRRNNLQLFSGV